MVANVVSLWLTTLAVKGIVSSGCKPALEHVLGDATCDPKVPAGFRLEPWSPQNDDQFRTVRNAAFEDYWGLAPMPADNWANRMTDHTFRPELSFLIVDGTAGSAVGMVLTKYWEADTESTGLRDAYVILLGTLASHRRAGVASALLARVLQVAREERYDRVVLRVDSMNSQQRSRIFEHAGFVPSVRSVRWVRRA